MRSSACSARSRRPTDERLRLPPTNGGFARRGLVIDVLVDCTTGTVGAEAYGVVLALQPLSERALAVHRPREACLARGFSPRF